MGVLVALLAAPPPASALLGNKKKTAERAGALLFHDRGCDHCHGQGGIGGKKGPPLTRLYRDRQWSPARITHQILYGGKKMPAFGDSVTDAEAAELVAYLRARHKPTPPPPAGQ